MSYKESLVAMEVDVAENGVHIHSLPEEILEYIFSFLNIHQRIEVDRVCKRWQLIGKTWHFPFKLFLDDRQSKSFEKIAGSKNCHLTCSPADKRIVSSVLSRCGACLKVLSLGCWNVERAWVSEELLQEVAEYCPNLVEIELYAVPLNDSLRILTNGCLKVKTVKLKGYPSLTDKELLVVTAGWKKLVCLDVFASLNLVAGSCFQQLSEYLRVLRLQSSSDLQPDALETLTKKCPSIKELHVPCCDKINPQNLSGCLRHYQNTLESLNLNWYQYDINICEGITVLHKLQELHVDNCCSVNDEFCHTLARNCPNLLKLHMCGTGISDQGLSYLASELDQLTDIDVSRTAIIGDGIEMLATNGRLELLLAYSCKNIPEASPCFHFAIRSSPNLSFVDVRNTKSISSQFIKTCQELVRCGFFKGPITLVVDKVISEVMSACRGNLRICNVIKEEIYP